MNTIPAIDFLLVVYKSMLCRTGFETTEKGPSTFSMDGIKINSVSFGAIDISFTELSVGFQ